jgi:UDP-glucose 4-epimerase
MLTPQRILVTGGAGFIGSAIVEHMLHAGHEVKVLDNLSTGALSNIEPLLQNPTFNTKLEFIQQSVTNRTVLEPLIEWCDHCYHMAAPVGVKYIMSHPVLTILDNIRGIDAVLEYCNRYSKRVLVASTSEVYGKSLDLLDPTRQHKLTESDYRVEGSTTNHRWAYANTKAMDEFLSLAYYKEHGLRVTVARFFNTVGPRQVSVYGMVVPNFVQRALANEPIIIYGDGQQQRSFMHVQDVLRAITGLMDREDTCGEVFNIGNPFEITIQYLAERVIALSGSTSTLEFRDPETYYGKGFEDMNRRTADITKLRTTLGFDIEYDLDGILLDVIAHHRQPVGV